MTRKCKREIAADGKIMCCLIKTVRRSRPVMEVRKKMATVLGMLLDTTQFSFNDIVRIIIVEVAAL